MLISKLYIENFRNFNEIEIDMNNNINFIVGENGIGKSSILELINYILNKNSFLESDFNDFEKEIKIIMTIKLTKEEQGYFSDLFDPNDEEYINITVIQESPKGRIEYKHLETSTIINFSKIRNIPCVYYNSVQSPEELNFNKTRSAGKFLNSIIDSYVEINKVEAKDIVKEDKIQEITQFINTVLNNIKVIKSNNVSTKVDNNSISLIPKLIGLSDEKNISINNMGSGIVYMSYIFLEILNTIANTLKYNKSIIITDKNDKKYLPIIITLDEPEIHLHPYMQRTIVKQIKNIMNNKDENFSSLLKEWFNIDEISGQVVIATHSANILSDNYNEYIRLYKKEQKITSLTGSKIVMNKKLEKHLLLQAESIKETFFSKVVTIFEGISEVGTIPFFANKLGVDFDEMGIGIIAADGAESVRKIKQLLEKFDISVVAVIDKDVYNLNDQQNGILSTNLECLEFDITDKIIKNNAMIDIIKITREYMQKPTRKVIIPRDALIEHNKKYNIISEEINNSYSIQDALKSEDEKIKMLVLTKFFSKKDVILGRIIGKLLSTENIPEVYVNAINRAKELSENV